jgi:uncharacterized protein with PQ loop repeat
VVLAGLLDYAPIAATAFAIPQFLPQILKLGRTGDSAGVSWSWATLTSLNNGAWFVYFTLSRFWTALAPASSATVLAGLLALMLSRCGEASARAALLIGAWAVSLGAGFTIAGRAGLGTLLTASFVLQVIPSIWAAYRTRSPSGISRGTWLLIFGELLAWAVYGFHKSDPRLIVLGCTGVAASTLILTRSALATIEQRRDTTARSQPASAANDGAHPFPLVSGKSPE